MTSVLGGFATGVRAAVAVVVSMALAASGRADIHLPACFGSRMVLQQGRPLPVWGTADPGETIEVRFGDSAAVATTDRDGRWQVVLPVQHVSPHGRPLAVKGRTTVILHDVLVGDVWLCAGQSNMLMPVGKSSESAEALATADDPLLRLLPLTVVAGGDRPAYTPDQIAALRPNAFTAGQWEQSNAQAARRFSAVAFFFGRRLRKELRTPVGLIQLAVGGTPIEAWVSRRALASHPATAGLVAGRWLDNPLVGAWCRERATANLARAVAAREPIPGDDLGPNHPFKPGFLWEAGMGALAPCPIAGVCWYQGESNAETAELVEQHERTFPVLVESWRQAWQREDLPFGFVQLPSLSRPHWPAFRESQRRLAASLPHIGMVVTIDCGDRLDVHPRDKRPIGERLADWALADVYGRHDMAGLSPMPISAVRLSDGRVRVRFVHAGEGLHTNDARPPRHCEAAVGDGTFQPADAEIDGDSLLVAVASRPIQRIRYAWQPFPEPPVNLVGATGLPVTPFDLHVTEPPAGSPSRP